MSEATQTNGQTTETQTQTTEGQSTQTTTTQTGEQTQQSQPNQQQSTQQTQQQGQQGSDNAWTLDSKAFGEGVSADFVSGYTDLAKAVGLDQTQAGDLLGKALAMANQIEAKADEVRVAEWTNTLKNDPNFGGEMFEPNLKIAQSALKQFGSPELVHLLNVTGLGNNPDVVKFFWNVGKTIQEDSVVSGATARSDTDIARIMFPTMKQ